MTSFDDLYDFYPESESTEKEFDDDHLHLNNSNTHKKHQMLHSYQHAVLIVLAVIVILFMVECLKRFIKSRRAKSS